MARVQEPDKGRVVISVMYVSMDAIADALKVLERKFGPVQFETLEIPCQKTELYREEMGEGLLRRFFSFERIVPRESLAEIKRICHKIEPEFADHIQGYDFRAVNVDPGILTPNNLVMASHRELNHRIYLNDGVFAEITLIYTNGGFRRLPWTHPDFCDNEAIDFFTRVRSSFELAESVA